MHVDPNALGHTLAANAEDALPMAKDAVTATPSRATAHSGWPGAPHPPG